MSMVYSRDIERIYSLIWYAAKQMVQAEFSKSDMQVWIRMEDAEGHLEDALREIKEVKRIIRENGE